MTEAIEGTALLIDCEPDVFITACQYAYTAEYKDCTRGEPLLPTVVKDACKRLPMLLT